MIRNQWYAVLESTEVGRTPVGRRRMGEDLVFWRDGSGQLFCHTDRCCHRGAALSAGTIRDGRLQCPFHGLEYDGDGRCVLIPANGRITPVDERFRVGSYAVAEKHGFVFLWWGERRKELPPVPFFDDIDDSLAYTTRTSVWNMHYSRCIENQLDAPHVPFVHRTTIGRGIGTVVDGPVVEWKGADRFFVYVHSRRDDGTPALRPDRMPKENSNPFRLEFIFPNLWQNHIFDKMRIVVAFVPVDEENTFFYLRFYQKIVTLPVLNRIFCELAQPYNMKVLGQDHDVVVTQRPKKTALKMDEQLFPADLPIVEYRRKRDELQKKNG